MGHSSTLVDQLPEALAVAVRLDEAGYDREVIGVALGVPQQSVRTVLRVAALKLRGLADQAEPGAERAGRTERAGETERAGGTAGPGAAAHE